MARSIAKAESNSNIYYLPEEILIHIFIRLAVKSLLRLMSVCKSWYSLLINPTFIQAHLKTSSQNSCIILNYRKTQRPIIYHYSIRYDNESFGEYYEPQLPSHIPKNSLRVSGSCNGLICLSNESTICLWNPALGKLKTLPKSLILDSTSIFHPFDTTITADLAFGFHPGVNDYKVVRIIHQLPHRIGYPAAEVYSLSTNSWKRIDVALDPSYGFICRSPAILNGAAYWVAGKETIEGIRCFLVRFEMGDEVFEEVMLPDGARHCYPYNIAVLGESLYLFGQFVVNECCGVWTMESGKMGSWTKRFTVNFGDDTHLLCLRKSGELLQVNHKGNLVSYNFETQRTKDLGYHGCILFPYSYVESLIQLVGAESLFPPDNGNPPCELASRRRIPSDACDAAIYKEHIKNHGFLAATLS